MTRHSCCKQNLWRAFVDCLTDNDEKLASSKKHTQNKSAKTLPYLRPKWPKSIPSSVTKTAKNHTLWSRTYVYSPYEGYPRMLISSRDGVKDVRFGENSAQHSDWNNQPFYNNCDKMLMQFIICQQCHDAINTSTTSVVRTAMLLFFWSNVKRTATKLCSEVWREWYGDARHSFTEVCSYYHLKRIRSF